MPPIPEIITMYMQYISDSSTKVSITDFIWSKESYLACAWICRGGSQNRLYFLYFLYFIIIVCEANKQLFDEISVRSCTGSYKVGGNGHRETPQNVWKCPK